MDNYEKNYLSQRPEELCNRCGKCCRVVTTAIPYPKLVEMSEAGDKSASDFLSIFVPFESIEAARQESAEIVDNIIEKLNQDNKFNEDEITFYKCQYLSDDNLCTRYESRLTLCKRFPGSPWAIVPPNCGYEGWLFMKREETKQKIRKVKEDLLELQLLKSKTISPDIKLKIASVEKKMQDSIELYKKQGSYDW